MDNAFAYVHDFQNIQGRDMAVFVKIVWNSFKWQLPSGSMKNPKDGSYYARYGFGHEEWDFRTDHNFDRSIYGFMMARPANLKRLGYSEDEAFPVYFYSSPFDTGVGDTFLIGGYLKSRYVAEDEIGQLKDFHKKSAIFDERIDEVFSVVSERSSFGNISHFKTLSIIDKRRIIENVLDSEGYEAKRYLKCPIEEVVVFPEPIPIDKYLKQLMSRTNVFGKYTRPMYLPVYPVILNKFGSSRIITTELSLDVESGLSEDHPEVYKSETSNPHDISYIQYELRSRTREYCTKEFELVNRFMVWLKTAYGIKSFKEIRYIDLCFDYNGLSFGVEAKYSDGALRFPIRAALGQILEYNFYPGRVPKNHWILLLNREPNKADQSWVDKLEIGVPLSLCWDTENGFEFTHNPLDV
ncbi:MAG: hypothetical protein K9W43_13690 [Candidatus Thorarchaeota archaeon]|nr:hypothetical protein [Candidatus Thorarchaeota archaeon]